jgi:hypothetical protein
MEKNLEDVLHEQEQAELLQLACSRGFTVNQLAKQLEHSWLSRQNPSDDILSLTELLRAVNRGEFDHLLKDSSGQSYS